jgi:hypothetical protein
MVLIIQKSVSTVQTLSDGKKKSAFKIIKQQNGDVKEISGISTDNIGNEYKIEENIKKIIPKKGVFVKKHRVFKIKSSEIGKLLKEDTIYLKNKDTKAKSKKSKDTKGKSKSANTKSKSTNTKSKGVVAKAKNTKKVPNEKKPKDIHLINK